jgi:CBS-domain-containing membrane protein
MAAGGNDDGGLDPAFGVAPETTLEDLMPRMASHPEGLAILNDGGAIVGRVTPQDIVRALAAADAESA